jgi:hypothetical protein
LKKDRTMRRRIALLGLLLSVGVLVSGVSARAEGKFRNIKPYDMRGAQLRGVRAITAETSADRVALAAYGDDQAFIDAIERAVLYIRSQKIPIDVVWADNVHAGGDNAIDIYIEGLRIIPGDGKKPFAIDSDPNDVAQAIIHSFNYWKDIAKQN